MSSNLILAAVGGISGALVGALIAYNVGWYVGDRAGYNKAMDENRQAFFDQIKERQETDAAVTNMSDRELCELIGGVFTNGACS